MHDVGDDPSTACVRQAQADRSIPFVATAHGHDLERVRCGRGDHQAVQIGDRPRAGSGPLDRAAQMCGEQPADLSSRSSTGLDLVQQPHDALGCNLHVRAWRRRGRHDASSAGAAPSTSSDGPVRRSHTRRSPSADARMMPGSVGCRSILGLDGGVRPTRRSAAPSVARSIVAGCHVARVTRPSTVATRHGCSTPSRRPRRRPIGTAQTSCVVRRHRRRSPCSTTAWTRTSHVPGATATGCSGAATSSAEVAGPSPRVTASRTNRTAVGATAAGTVAVCACALSSARGVWPVWDACVRGDDGACPEGGGCPDGPVCSDGRADADAAWTGRSCAGRGGPSRPTTITAATTSHGPSRAAISAPRRGRRGSRVASCSSPPTGAGGAMASPSSQCRRSSATVRSLSSRIAGYYEI